MKGFRHLEGVATLQLDTKKCVGCGMCATVCPHRVLAMKGKKAEIMHLDACMECGACTMNCPTEAVTVTPGVGCAALIIQTWIKGKGNATCDSACC